MTLLIISFLDVCLINKGFFTSVSSATTDSKRKETRQGKTRQGESLLR